VRLQGNLISGVGVLGHHRANMSNVTNRFLLILKANRLDVC
jgi:hypothetical protein